MSRHLVFQAASFAYAMLISSYYAAGRLGMFVRDSLQPFILLTVVVLVALSFRVPSRAEPYHRFRRQCARFLLILLPPVAAMFVPLSAMQGSGLSPAYIESTINGPSAITPEILSLARWNPYRQGDRYAIEVDKVRLLERQPGAEYDSFPVVTIGWVLQRAGHEPALMRYFMICCAADALLQGVEMTGEAPVSVPDNTWLEVRGHLGPWRSDSRAFIVESWRAVPAPQNPYGSR